MNVAIMSKSTVSQKVLSKWTSGIPGASVVGNFPIGEEFYRLGVASQTDVLIMDFGEELEPDLNLVKQLSRKFRNMGILVVSTCIYPGFQKDLMSSGVDGCIERYFIHSELEPAIQKIYQGGSFFN
jgi:DNA-binding NarL/FixJ family response regulator